MASVLQCDGCGEVIESESLTFHIPAKRRTGSGSIVQANGMYDWDHLNTNGDLCSDCALPVVELLNETL